MSVLDVKLVTLVHCLWFIDAYGSMVIVNGVVLLLNENEKD